MRPGLQAGARPRRREPVEVAEPVRPDRRLAELGRLRGLRTGAAEREQQVLRGAWRGQRAALRTAIAAWRAAEERLHKEWQEARAAFFAMRSSSGQFRAAKAVYERARRDSALARAAAQGQAGECRDAGRRFFEACERLRAARKRQEKLAMLDQELKRVQALAQADA